MKKRIAAVLVLALAVSCLCAGASANSWGLTGDLYRAVEQAKAWDDYTLLGNQAGDFAVLKSRYHNALFWADLGNDLHVYTTAVYQPEDKKPAPKLEITEDEDLVLSYGDSESYTFTLTTDGYELTGAAVGDFRLETNPMDGDSIYYWDFSGSDGEGTAVFPMRITLDTFNIRLFPHSAAEVRNINLMHALLEDTRYCLGFGPDTDDAYSPDRPGRLLEPKQKGTAPVYSAPSEKSWRAGKGKAAVGLGGRLWVLTAREGADGNAWACIRYDVSERTQRIGWTQCKNLGLENETEDAAFARTPVKAIADTFLTDDPDVSQFAQFTVSKGTELACLGLYNDCYAYVEAKQNNGKLSGKGTITRGFVPVRDLQPAPSSVQKNIMKQAAGVWYAEGSAPVVGDLFTLNTDGTFIVGTAGGPDEEPETLEGTWYVTKYDAAEGIYWDDPAYRITLLYNNGHREIYGMTLTETHLSLTRGMGGGIYAPYDEDDAYDEDEEYDGDEEYDE